MLKRNVPFYVGFYKSRQNNKSKNKTNRNSSKKNKNLDFNSILQNNEFLLKRARTKYTKRNIKSKEKRNLMEKFSDDSLKYEKDSIFDKTCLNYDFNKQKKSEMKNFRQSEKYENSQIVFSSVKNNLRNSSTHSLRSKISTRKSYNNKTIQKEKFFYKKTKKNEKNKKQHCFKKLNKKNVYLNNYKKDKLKNTGRLITNKKASKMEEYTPDKIIFTNNRNSYNSQKNNFNIRFSINNKNNLLYKEYIKKKNIFQNKSINLLKKNEYKSTSEINIKYRNQKEKNCFNFEHKSIINKIHTSHSVINNRTNKNTRNITSKFENKKLINKNPISKSNFSNKINSKKIKSNYQNNLIKKNNKMTKSNFKNNLININNRISKSNDILKNNKEIKKSNYENHLLKNNNQISKSNFQNKIFKCSNSNLKNENLKNKFINKREIFINNNLSFSQTELSNNISNLKQRFNDLYNSYQENEIEFNFGKINKKITFLKSKNKNYSNLKINRFDLKIRNLIYFRNKRNFCIFFKTLKCVNNLDKKKNGIFKFEIFLNDIFRKNNENFFFEIFFRVLKISFLKEKTTNYANMMINNFKHKIDHIFHKRKIIFFGIFIKKMKISFIIKKMEKIILKNNFIFLKKNYQNKKYFFLNKLIKKITKKKLQDIFSILKDNKIKIINNKLKKISKQKKYFLKYKQIIFFEKLSHYILKNCSLSFKILKKNIKSVKFPKFSFKNYISFFLVLNFIFEKKQTKKSFLKIGLTAIKNNNIHLNYIESFLKKKINIQKSTKKLNFRKLVLFSKYYKFFKKIN